MLPQNKTLPVVSFTAYMTLGGGVARPRPATRIGGESVVRVAGPCGYLVVQRSGFLRSALLLQIKEITR